MKPDYLLHLDFQSIRLFLREETGLWRLVGRVAPDDHALDEAMKALVGRAKAAHGAPMHAVISLPYDLVFVTKVETDPEVGWVRRQVEIRAALDAALADPIEELAYDVETDGAVTTAVIVHRGTLQEADSFAKAHGIQPLAFIAMPRDGDGFHRPALFLQTALGTDRAGEAGLLEIDVPGTAALRGKTSKPTQREVEPRSRPVSEPEPPSEAGLEGSAVAADASKEAKPAPPPPQDEGHSDSAPTEPEPVAPALAPQAIRPPAADERPAPPVAAKKIVVDPFDKLAHPFVERPHDNWLNRTTRFLAPLAAVLAVVAALAGIAYYVLPPDEAPIEVSASTSGEDTAVDTEDSPPAEPPTTEPEPRDPLTEPAAQDAPEAPIESPAQDAAEATAEPAPRPDAVAGLDIPEDPTEPVSLAPLPSAESAQPEQPAPQDTDGTPPAPGAAASRDAARPAAVEAAPAAVLSARIGAAQGSAPVPLYDLLEPNLDADALAEVAARRPAGRPEGLFPVASDGTVLPPEFEGVAEFRPAARPDALSQASADGAPPADDTPSVDTPSADAPPEDAASDTIDENSTGAVSPGVLPPALQQIKAVRPTARLASAQAQTPAPAPAAATGLTAELAGQRPVARQAEAATPSPSLALAFVQPQNPRVAALADTRPAARQPGLAPAAEPEAEEAAPEALQVSFTALRPEVRPRGLRRGTANTATRASARGVTAPPPPQETQPQAAATQPTIRLGRSDLVLIGTSGTATSRRALVQVPGRGITSVGVGDRIDGGRVAAIDVTTLVYTRGGRTIRLQMPE